MTVLAQLLFLPRNASMALVSYCEHLSASLSFAAWDEIVAVSCQISSKAHATTGREKITLSSDIAEVFFDSPFLSIGGYWKFLLMSSSDRP